MPLFWDCLEAEEKGLVKLLMLKLGKPNWMPPHDDQRPIQLDAQLEPLEEIEKLMQTPPKGDAAILSGGSRGKA